TSSSGRRCWGRIEYLMGPKKVDCAPMANNTAISPQRLPRLSATTPAAMMTISASLTRRMMAAFSNLSASCPARGENRKNGSTNSAAARFTTVLVSIPAESPAATTSTSRLFLNRVPLKAPRHRVMNRGRKRRDLSRWNWLSESLRCIGESRGELLWPWWCRTVTNPAGGWIAGHSCHRPKDRPIMRASRRSHDPPQPRRPDNPRRPRTARRRCRRQSGRGQPRHSRQRRTHRTALDHHLLPGERPVRRHRPELHQRHPPVLRLPQPQLLPGRPGGTG